MEREELLNTSVEDVVRKLRELAEDYEMQAMMTMMGWEENVLTKAADLLENAVETVEATLLASIGDGGKSCHWCREKTYAQGMKDAAEIVEGFGETEIAEVIYAAIGGKNGQDGS